MIKIMENIIKKEKDLKYMKDKKKVPMLFKLRVGENYSFSLKKRKNIQNKRTNTKYIYQFRFKVLN
jgi:hypothetical protein